MGSPGSESSPQTANPDHQAGGDNISFLKGTEIRIRVCDGVVTITVKDL